MAYKCPRVLVFMIMGTLFALVGIGGMTGNVATNKNSYFYFGISMIGLGAFCIIGAVVNLMFCQSDGDSSDSETQRLLATNTV